MGVLSRRGRTAASIGGVVAIAALALFGAVGPANAEVENPPLIVGTPVMTSDCSEGVATFTVTVPRVEIYDTVDGYFLVDGAAVGVESFPAFTQIGPFIRSVDVPLVELPATLSATYIINDGTILWPESFTFTAEECGVTPPPVVEVTQVRMDSYCEGATPFGAVRVAMSVPEGADPATLGVVYGAEQPLGTSQTVTASGEYSFAGPLPVGDTPFTVILNGFAAGEGILTVKSCEVTTPPAGNEEVTTPPAGNEEKPNPLQVEEDNSSYVPKDGGEYVTGDTVLDSAAASSASQVNSLGFALGGISLLALAVMITGVVSLVRERRTQSVKG